MQIEKGYELCTIEEVNWLLQSLLRKAKTAYCLSHLLDKLLITRSSAEKGLYRVGWVLDKSADVSIQELVNDSDDLIQC